MSANTKVAMTLSNSIIGVSILAMPFCMKQCGIVLGTLMLVLSSLLTRFTCHLLLKSAVISRRKTFEFVAYHTFGSLGKLAAEINIIGFMLGILISFFVVIGDLGPEIISKAFNIENTGTLRTLVLLVLGFAVALPLSMLKEVDTLAQLSALSILFYVVLALKTIMEAIPVLGTSGWTDKIVLWNPSGILQSLPIFALALSCQTQIFEVYEALPNPSLKQMNLVVKMAVYLCTSVYLSVGIFGYVSNFNKEFTGNILLSFTPGFSTDVIKFMFVLSVAMGFPLVVLPCRASVNSLLLKKSGNPFDVGGSFIPETRFKLITLAIVSSTLLLGVLCPNIELVLGFLGSTIGVFTCIIFPAILFTRLTSKYTFEKWGSQFVFILGLVLLASCTWVNLSGKTEPVERMDEALAARPLDRRPNNNNVDVLLANVRAADVRESTSDKVKDNGLPPKVSTKVHSKPTEKQPAEVEPERKLPAPKAEEDLEHFKLDKLAGDQQRHEPPVPQEPDEVAIGEANKDKNAKIADDKKDNEINAEALKKEDTELEIKVQADQAAADEKKSEQEKAALLKQEDILRQLEESQKKQKELMEQQQEILKELKAHEKSHDHDAPAGEKNIVPEVQVKAKDSEVGPVQAEVVAAVKRPIVENKSAVKQSGPSIAGNGVLPAEEPKLPAVQPIRSNNELNANDLAVKKESAVSGRPIPDVVRRNEELPVGIGAAPGEVVNLKESEAEVVKQPPPKPIPDGSVNKSGHNDEKVMPQPAEKINSRKVERPLVAAVRETETGKSKIVPDVPVAANIVDLSDDLPVKLESRSVKVVSASPKVGGSEMKPEVVGSEMKPEAVGSEMKREVVGSEMKPKVVGSERKPEVSSEVKPEVSSEVKPEVSPEVKPEVSPEVKPEVSPEVKPEVKRDAVVTLVVERAASQLKNHRQVAVSSLTPPKVVALSEDSEVDRVRIGATSAPPMVKVVAGQIGRRSPDQDPALRKR